MFRKTPLRRCYGIAKPLKKKTFSHKRTSALCMQPVKELRKTPQKPFVGFAELLSKATRSHKQTSA